MLRCVWEYRLWSPHAFGNAVIPVQIVDDSPVYQVKCVSECYLWPWNVSEAKVAPTQCCVHNRNLPCGKCWRMLPLNVEMCPKQKLLQRSVEIWSRYVSEAKVASAQYCDSGTFRGWGSSRARAPRSAVQQQETQSLSDYSAHRLFYRISSKL